MSDTIFGNFGSINQLKTVIKRAGTQTFINQFSFNFYLHSHFEDNFNKMVQQSEKRMCAIILIFIIVCGQSIMLQAGDSEGIFNDVIFNYLVLVLHVIFQMTQNQIVTTQQLFNN